VKPVNLTLTAKTEMAREAADYINSLANANGFSTATTNEELNQYVHWFINQIRECDKYIASNLVIEVSYQ
jgi:hypothetical protein